MDAEDFLHNKDRGERRAVLRLGAVGGNAEISARNLYFARDKPVDVGGDGAGGNGHNRCRITLR